MFYYLFSSLDPFSSISSLISMARTSKTIMNKSGKSGVPCLVPYLSGYAFNISPLRMMLAVGLWNRLLSESILPVTDAVHEKYKLTT